MDGKGGYNAFDLDGFIVDRSNGMIDGRSHFPGLGNAFNDFVKNGKPIQFNNVTIRTEYLNEQEETEYRFVKIGVFITPYDDGEAEWYVFNIAGVSIYNSYGTDYLDG